MKVEIWSDVICPWCYIGKRRFETALSRFEHADEIEVIWRAFELRPHAPRVREGDPIDRMVAKYGITRERAESSQRNMAEVAAGEGLDFQMERARAGNTFDAHRLLHLALDRGIQDQVKERLFLAYFTLGEPIGDYETLIRLGDEAGLDPGEARIVLDSDKYAAEVRDEEDQAAALGITGVPFFVLDRRYGVSGAQPPEMLLAALRKAWSDTHPLTMAQADDGELGCEGDSCEV